MAQPSDRRQRKRTQLVLPAAVAAKPNGAEPGAAAHLLTRDISSAGAYFLSVLPFPVGSLVQIEISIALAGPRGMANLEVSGRVVRADALGIAVAFDPEYRISPLFDPSSDPLAMASA